jgi:hypothetical protein
MAWVIGLLVVIILALIWLHMRLVQLGQVLIEWLESIEAISVRNHTMASEMKVIENQQKELVRLLEPISSHYYEQERLRRDYERDRDGP